jgi:glyoxylase-like metal-dependent hydrolase (beta-lactamase superfamily II)
MDVVPLVPGLHFLRFEVGHAYLWRGEDGLTLIDTSVAGSGALIARAICELGLDPADLRRVVLTHFHGDHAGAAGELTGWGGAEVVAHRADAPFIQGKAAGPPPVLAGWERPLFERVTAQMSATPVRAVRVDQEVADGDVLGFGGGAQCVAAPGHTPGSLALYLPGPRVLFAGDAAARDRRGQVMLGVFNTDPPQAVASFKRLATLGAGVVCFGHGEPLTDAAAARMQAAAEALTGSPPGEQRS